MCSKVQCSSCKKPSWVGCGMHIESALRGVSEADRCAGWRTGRCVAKAVESAYVPEAADDAEKKK
jgi:hypothetical protein